MAESDPRGGDRAPINVFVEWRKAELARLVDESDLPPTRATPARAGSHPCQKQGRHDHARHVDSKAGAIQSGGDMGLDGPCPPSLFVCMRTEKPIHRAEGDLQALNPVFSGCESGSKATRRFAFDGLENAHKSLTKQANLYAARTRREDSASCITRHCPSPAESPAHRPRSSSVFQHRDSGGRLSRPRPARQLLVELERDRGDWRRPSIHKVTAAAEPISASGATRSQGALDRPRDPFKTKELSARNRQSSRRTEAMPRGGIRSTSFKPGVSGNPGGRPKTPQTIEVRRIILGVREAARELTLDAIDTLATIMKDPKAPAAARISAAVALLDRGHGRPFQAVDVKDGVDLGLLSDEELYTLDAILSRASVPAPDPSRHYLTAR